MGEQHQCSYLAQGLIFSASPRLIQNPAPPVANQKCTGCCERGTNAVRQQLLLHPAQTRPAPNSPHAHHLVLADPLRSLDGPVQAGLPDVDVLCVGVAGEQLHQHPHVHVVVIVHVAEPPAVTAVSQLTGTAPQSPAEIQPQNHKWSLFALSCPPSAPLSPTAAPDTAYFLPDSMNLSYSTAILQDRAWRLWAAEQLVLMTFPAGKKRGRNPALVHPTPPHALKR